MRSEIRLWAVQGNQLGQLARPSFPTAHKEKDLETWVEQSPDLLDHDLTILGRQLIIPKVGRIDLLAYDDTFRLFIIEFKRDCSTRDTIAQLLDYASALKGMQVSYLLNLLNLPATAELNQLDTSNPAMIMVAAEADVAAERIAEYLTSSPDFSIEVVTFTYATLADGQEILARSVLVADQISKPKSTGLPRPAVAEILNTAKIRGVLPSVNELRQAVQKGWREDLGAWNGGTFRYWASLRNGRDVVMFGMNVGGEKFGSPDGVLDVWVNVETVSEYIQEPLENVLVALAQFPRRPGHNRYFIEISDQKQAADLLAVFVRWQAQGPDQTP